MRDRSGDPSLYSEYAILKGLVFLLESARCVAVQ